MMLPCGSGVARASWGIPWIPFRGAWTRFSGHAPSTLLLLVAAGFTLAYAGGCAVPTSGLRLARVISFDGADGQRAFRLSLERDVVQVQDAQRKLLATLVLRTESSDAGRTREVLQVQDANGQIAYFTGNYDGYVAHRMSRRGPGALKTGWPRFKRVEPQDETVSAPSPAP